MNKTTWQMSEVLSEKEIIVSMLKFRNQILIATNKNLYKLDDDGLHMVKFEMKEDQKDASSEV